MGCFTADAGGAPVFAASQAGKSHVLIWDLRWKDSASAKGGSKENSERRLLSNVPDQPSYLSLALNVASDRIFAGLDNGNVYIWTFVDGIHLATCEYYVLESTSWSSIGHAWAVCLVASADARVSGMPGSSVVSADRSGVVCLWRDNGDCPACLQPAYFASRVEAPYGEFADLSVSVGLIAVAMQRAIFGFTVPGNQIAFIISSMYLIHSSTILAIEVFYQPGADTMSVVAITRSGTVLSSDVARSPSRIAHAMDLIVGPCRAASTNNDMVRSVASCAGNSLCWVKTLGSGGYTIRWLEEPRLFQDGVDTVATRFIPQVFEAQAHGNNCPPRHERFFWVSDRITSQFAF